MASITVFAVYFVVWWVTFVAMANMGEKSQADLNDIQRGTPAGAPHSFNLKRKVFWVTIVAAIVTGFIYWVIAHSGLTLDDYPFMPDYSFNKK